MKFTTSTILASAAALVSASPIDSPLPGSFPAVNEPFGIVAIRSGAPFQYASVQAMKRGFRLGAASQNASCSSDTSINSATFQLTEKGELFLYTANPPQQAFVDRSGMGQGIIQYTTGVQQIGRNQERAPFKIDADSNLIFDSGNGVSGFQACPSPTDEAEGYSIWLTGLDKPGFLEGCLPFTAKALKAENPIKCSYTQE